MKIIRKIQKYIINSKIQKLFDRATNLDIDFDDFIQKYVIPKLIAEDGKELSFKFKSSHRIGRYFVCTGLSGLDACGEDLHDKGSFLPFKEMSVWDKERLIKVLQEEGFFNEQ